MMPYFFSLLLVDVLAEDGKFISIYFIQRSSEERRHAEDGKVFNLKFVIQ